ncbi:hypothetical protein [Nocardiopsis sp. NRRL B-16309]|uniref:hypothetical protein n=1 Tax=Nocardiopsis sp. NRRL B-16309 TaxID=1519494 RepID=UPI0006ADF823|nr:hypothetical protein [Nocardiopsis sp. NRRL B-16309]KOX17032.1 hypothetical protein ADL05_10680 [Nocardiopsis sp. NRRL B-16309]
MIDRIGTLGDRLLARVVPTTRATASTFFCRWEGCGGNARLQKKCCYVAGVGQVSCTSCRLT